ncbi:MAG: lysophospholipid acyltransferase family protein [Cyanobacteria bacterium P01_H01_bin.121]
MVPLSNQPLELSQQLLSLLGVQVSTQQRDHIPADVPVLVISNHRSFLDAPLLMAAMERSIAFACHHYMGQLPGLRELVTMLGAFPLEASEQRSRSFFQQATQRLQEGSAVGVFPEGTPSMVKLRPSDQLWQFQQGFAHLVARTKLSRLCVLPVAIAPQRESLLPSLPMQLFQWLDPDEPLFTESAWHPVVTYQQVSVRFGTPFHIEPSAIPKRGQPKARWIRSLSQACQQEVELLLRAA